jgi:hypothetical protein
MVTNKHLTSVLAAAALLAAAASFNDRHELLEGKQPRQQPTNRPTVHASFPRESYRAGERARLIVRAIATNVRVQIFRAGAENMPIHANDLMLGVAMARPVDVGRTRDRTIVRLRIGDWASGLYFARLTADGGRIGHAPFVLRPKRLGESRVAVVLPTQTWQAYNFSDDDDDGSHDTWYAGGSTARIGRPFENRGVPTHYKRYDQPFLRWLVTTGRRVDYLAQADLNRVGSGRVLARAYDLMVFHGHHEYVTKQEYDAVEQFRDLGGNLIFLSANNFFWKVTLRGDVMTRVRQWRDLGRPESALIGVQYFGNDNGSHRRPWIVRNAYAADGLMASAGLSNGAALSTAGIEVDGMTSASPRGTKLVATMAWRRGKIAHMTYYQTARGARVFAAGAFSLAREAMSPDVQRVLEQLWRRLARP